MPIAGWSRSSGFGPGPSAGTGVDPVEDVAGEQRQPEEERRDHGDDRHRPRAQRRPARAGGVRRARPGTRPAPGPEQQRPVVRGPEAGDGVVRAACRRLPLLGDEPRPRSRGATSAHSMAPTHSACGQRTQRRGAAPRRRAGRASPPTNADPAVTSARAERQAPDRRRRPERSPRRFRRRRLVLVGVPDDRPVGVEDAVGAQRPSTTAPWPSRNVLGGSPRETTATSLARR